MRERERGEGESGKSYIDYGRCWPMTSDISGMAK